MWLYCNGYSIEAAVKLTDFSIVCSNNEFTYKILSDLNCAN